MNRMQHRAGKAANLARPSARTVESAHARWQTTRPGMTQDALRKLQSADEDESVLSPEDRSIVLGALWIWRAQ